MISVKVTEPCPILCNHMDCRPPGSSVHGILQARILECVAVPFSWEDPDPGIEPGSPTLQADSLPTEPPTKAQINAKQVCNFTGTWLVNNDTRWLPLMK